MSFNWTPEVIDQLCALWDEGVSTEEIGRRLGCSKGCVIGKAHRMGCDPRPSPVAFRKIVAARRERGPKPKPAPKLRAITPPLPAPPPRPQTVLARTGGTLPSVRPLVAAGAATSCQFPIGDPREKDFRFCGELVWKRSYCLECYRIAYVRVRAVEIA